MQGLWIPTKLETKPENDKNAGDKFWFEEEQTQLAFGALKTARHRERFGNLTLKSGDRVIFQGTGKLIQTDKYPKDKKGSAGLSKFQFRPTERIDSKEFAKLRGYCGVGLEAQFLHSIEKGEDAPADPEPLEDDNVVPGSLAAQMKQDAKAKTAATA